MQTETEPQTDVRKQCFAIATKIGLSRAERHELAEMALKADCTSWGQLSDSQMRRLADFLEGFVLVHYLFTLRG